jgi:hypothetical protein
MRPRWRREGEWRGWNRGGVPAGHELRASSTLSSIQMIAARGTGGAVAPWPLRRPTVDIECSGKRVGRDTKPSRIRTSRETAHGRPACE